MLVKIYLDLIVFNRLIIRFEFYFIKEVYDVLLFEELVKILEFVDLSEKEVLFNLN